MYSNAKSAEIGANHNPWNKGRLIGPKPPLKLREIWAIRIRLQLAQRVRDLALFNLSIDSKLRGCDGLHIAIEPRNRAAGSGFRRGSRGGSVLAHDQFVEEPGFDMTGGFSEEVARAARNLGGLAPGKCQSLLPGNGAGSSPVDSLRPLTHSLLK